MKKLIFLISASMALFSVNNYCVAQSSSPVMDSVFMGAGYGNEVYYSMSGGNRGTVNRKQWDIAFHASRMSASILTNDAANNNLIGLSGVELYTYENADTSGWASLDTTGLYTWKLLVNSTTDWETGAFCQNQTGHPDYGWGRYNAATHDVVGDSIYIIKLRDGGFRKLWIMRKYSGDNIYEFRYANLDGTNDTTVLLDCSPYAAKNFVGYSLTTNQVVDFEPVESTQWDILFAKYMYTYPDGVLYPVTGILSNYGIKVNKFEHVEPGYRMFNLESMDSTRSPIGWEWKYYDFTNNVYLVVDSLAYFIQDQSGDIYKLVFKEFAGSSTGRIVLEKELISLAGIEEIPFASFNMAVYPNPAFIETNLLVNPGPATFIKVCLNDISGRPVWQNQLNVKKNDLNRFSIPVNQLPDGIYMLSVNAGTNKLTRKIIIQH